jgi:hypothetical protein
VKLLDPGGVITSEHTGETIFEGYNSAVEYAVYIRRCITGDDRIPLRTPDDLLTLSGTFLPRDIGEVWALKLDAWHDHLSLLVSAACYKVTRLCFE